MADSRWPTSLRHGARAAAAPGEPLAARARARAATRASSSSTRLRARGARPRRRLRRARACARFEPGLDITGVDLAERPGYPGPFVRADAADGLPFADGEFDLVYCSSVIEHVPPDAPRRVRRRAAARRARLVRADAGVLVPDRAALAAAGRALAAARRLRRPYWRLGAAGDWEDDRAARRGEIEALFGPAARRALRRRSSRAGCCVSPPAG